MKKWKTTGIVLLTLGCALMLIALAYPESIREDQPVIQTAQERANMEEHGSDEASSPLESARETTSQLLFDDNLIFRSAHFLYAGILFFTAGGTCLIISLRTARAPPRKM